MPVPTFLATLGIVGRPRHDMGCRGADLLVAARAPIRLRRRGAGQGSHVPVTVRVRLDARVRHIFAGSLCHSTIFSSHTSSVPKTEEAPTLEQAGRHVRCALELVVIEQDATDSTIFGKRACLGFDLLRGEDPADGGDEWVAIQ